MRELKASVLGSRRTGRRDDLRGQGEERPRASTGTGRSWSWKWVVAASAVLCLAGYVYVYATDRADPPIRSDGFSYYVYLPSWFIYHDPTLRRVADDCCGGQFPEFTAIIRWPGTRRWVNAHPIGVAVLQAPFFVIADVLSWWSNLSRDGFTLYYQHAAGVAGVFWTVAGLWVLGALLRRHFGDGVTALTLFALLFGTNLYHYATFDSSYSHGYSFFLVSAFLTLTDLWHHSPTRRRAALIGVVSGLIVLTRHTNALVLLLFPLYGVRDRASGISAVQRLHARWRDVAVIVITGLVVIAPQLALYYQATGRMLVSSYGDLGFNWGTPRLFGVLFSVQKGLFFWSPLLLLATAGLFLVRNRLREFLPAAVLVLAANTYVIASWWDWQFGGSYGHRGFVDMLPIFALGLAALFESTARRPVLRGAVAVLVMLLSALSVVQMLQYWAGVLPFSDTTWEQYRALFLRLR
jgi:hypothetical protein